MSVPTCIKETTTKLFNSSMDKPSYILVGIESNYWPEFMSLSERLSLECGDVVNLTLKGVLESCLVISKGTQEACEKVMKAQRSKRSRISDDPPLSKKRKNCRTKVRLWKRCHVRRSCFNNGASCD